MVSHVWLFASSWTAARQASLSITNSKVYANSCPLSQWCHPIILSSDASFSSCPQSFPASESFPMSQLFASGGQRTDALEFWSWRRLESPLDSKAIKPINPKGNQPWIFTGRTDAEALILWSPDAKSWLTGKDSDARKDQRWEEKRVAEDKMIGWHHWLNGHEFQ